MSPLHPQLACVGKGKAAGAEPVAAVDEGASGTPEDEARRRAKEEKALKKKERAEREKEKREEKAWA